MNSQTSQTEIVDEECEELRRQLAQQIGIADGFHDIWGHYHETSNQTRNLILESLSLNADSADLLRQKLHELRNEHWSRALAPVYVHRKQTMPLSVALVNLYQDSRIRIRIHAENGDYQDLEYAHEELEVLDSHDTDGNTVQQIRVPIEPEPETGYYRLEYFGNENTLRDSSCIIVAPQRCWWPQDDSGSNRYVGVALQLYAIRSDRNWGIGDFTDLLNSIEFLASSGVDVIGLNPLHALLPDQPDQRSPYFPSSRYFLNPLYLDPTDLTEYQLLPETQRDDYQQRAQELGKASLIDYPAVARLKHEALDACFELFCDSTATDLQQARQQFKQFEIQYGELLDDFSNFEAATSSVKSAASKSRYLQWRSTEQLHRCANLADSLDMTFGLYTDLAIGSNADGADARNMPDLFVSGMEIGAPPDDFSPQGQSWGLPPVSPLAVRQQHYQPFIDLLRCNMRDAGLLRIDHVMGLMHQFWIPAGASGSEGAYVRFPLQDLLAIVALESQRHQCAVVGEDLGTVPDELRHEIAHAGLLSTRLLYFEKNWHGDHGFIDPGDYPEQAVVTIGGHDLATLYGYWRGGDLDQLSELGRLGDQQHTEQQYEIRRQDRERLIQLLQRNGFESTLNADTLEIAPQDINELATQVYELLGRTPCRIIMVQLTDVFAELDQINVPGTVDECPNWQRRLNPPLEGWSQHPALLQTLKAVRQQRPR